MLSVTKCFDRIFEMNKLSLKDKKLHQVCAWRVSDISNNTLFDKI